MAADVFVPVLLVCGLFGLIILAGIGMSYVSLLWFNAQMTKCPACGRRGAGEFLDAQVVDSKSSIERRSTAFRFGGQADRRVRVTEKTYEEHFRCEHCGHEWTRTAREKNTTPIKS
jgi:hypothetical protein